MARAAFGGGTADFVYTPGPSGYVRLVAASVTAWDSEIGGTRHTDLLFAGSAVTAVPVADDGQIPTFQGPDGVVSLWIDAGGATRSLLIANAVVSAIAAAAAAAAQVQVDVADQVSAARVAAAGAQAARDAAVGLVTSDLGTTDGQTRALIQDPNSQTASALSNSIAQAVGGLGNGVDTLFGYSGAQEAALEPLADFRATWMARNTWQNLAQGNYLGNNIDFTPWIQAHTDLACNIGTPLIPHDSGTDLNTLLDQAISGAHDQDYRDLGGSLAYWGNKTIYARLYWEMNLRNGSSGPGDVIDRSKFIAAWRRAVPLIREGFAAQTYYPLPGGRPAGQQLFIDFSPLSDGADYKAFYPGDDYVDVISMDVYPTIYGTVTPTPQALLASVNGYLNDIADFAELHDKPVALGEFSAWQLKRADGTQDSRGLGDFPDYIDAVFDWVQARNPAYVSYYDIADNTGLTLTDVPLTKARLLARLATLHPSNVQDDGTALPKRAAFNFAGDVTVTDDPANNRTTISVDAGGGSSATVSAARIYRGGSSNQTVGAGSVSFIDLNTVDFTLGDALDTSVPGQIKVLEAGLYTVGGSAVTTGGSAGLRNLQIRRSTDGGSTYAYVRSTGTETPGSADHNIPPFSDIIQLAANDIIKLSTYVNGGGAVDIKPGVDSTALYLVKLG